MKVDPISLTQTLVRINTVSGRAPEELCTQVLTDLLRKAGFACSVSEYAPGRTNLIAKLGGQPGLRPLVFTGHLDVVPIGAAPWTRDPFSADIVDGRLYGRGSSDMKAGVAAFVSAALEHADTLRHSPGLILAITAGEETGCDGARHMASQPQLSAMVGPLGAGALLVGEPSANRPLAGHKGVVWLRASAQGVTAHGSMPDKGVNAIYKLIPGLEGMRDFDFKLAESHPIMGRPTLNVGVIEGGLNVNSVPDYASFLVDLRTVPGVDHGELIDRIRQIVGKEVTIDVMLDLASVYTRTDDPWLRFICDLCIESEEPATVSYFTDAAVLRGALNDPPTVILGPGEPELAHQTDEYCRVDRIIEAQKLYGAIIRDWCTRERGARV